MLPDHPHVPTIPKKTFQNIRFKIVQGIASKSATNGHRLPAHIRYRAYRSQHVNRLGLGEHPEGIARVRARIVAGFVACYARRCLADRVISA
jgi:hypothetical protein